MFVQLLLAASLCLWSPLQPAWSTLAHTSITSISEHGSVKIADKKESSTYVDFTYPQLIGLKNAAIQKKINDQITARVYQLQKKNIFDHDTKYYWSTYEIPYQQNHILSIILNQSINAKRAAHPANYLSSITLDMRTGKELRFADLFKKGVPYEQKINELAKKQIKKLPYELIWPFKGITPNQAFYLNKDFLVIYYPEGEYTPHVVGPLKISIPYSEIKDLLAMPLLK